MKFVISQSSTALEGIYIENSELTPNCLGCLLSSLVSYLVIAQGWKINIVPWFMVFDIDHAVTILNS